MPPALPCATRYVGPIVGDSCLLLFFCHVALKPIHRVRRMVSTLNYIHNL